MDQSERSVTLENGNERKGLPTEISINPLDEKVILPAENGVSPQDEKLERSNSRKSSSGMRNGTFLQDVHIDGNKMSQGIILNAAHFVSSDGKEYNLPHPQESTENGIKSCETKSEEKKCEEEKEPVGEMTIFRKIVFGFSFFPSVMFVLCFAVILPCEEYVNSKPCALKRWSTTLNETDLTARLLTNHQLLLGFRRNSTEYTLAGLISLDISSGEEQWSKDLNSWPKVIDCNSVDANGDGLPDCLLVTEGGVISAFNSSDGYVFWSYRTRSENEKTSSLPVALPNCPMLNDSDALAIASINSERILSLEFINRIDGLRMSFQNTTMPTSCIDLQLMKWEYGNGSSSDLVIFCGEGSEAGSTWLLRQEDWCSSDAKIPNGLNPQLFTRSKMQNSKASIFLTNDGLSIWDGILIKFIPADTGDEWMKDDFPASLRNAIYGSFYENGRQIGFILDRVSNGSEVVLLNVTDGEILKSWNITEGEIADISVIKGKSRDYILVSVVKLDSAVKSVALSDNVTQGPTVEYMVSDQTTTSQEPEMTYDLVLLQYDDKAPQKTLYSQKIDIHCSNDVSCTQELRRLKTIVAAKDKEMLKKLHVVVSRTYEKSFENGEKTLFTKLDDLEFENWDSSEEKFYICKK